MHILQAFEHLVYDVLFMNLLKNISSYNSMEIGIHEVKHEINIPIVLCSDNVL